MRNKILLSLVVLGLMVPAVFAAAQEEEKGSLAMSFDTKDWDQSVTELLKGEAEQIKNLLPETLVEEYIEKLEENLREVAEDLENGGDKDRVSMEKFHELRDEMRRDFAVYEGDWAPAEVASNGYNIPVDKLLNDEKNRLVEIFSDASKDPAIRNYMRELDQKMQETAESGPVNSSGKIGPVSSPWRLAQISKPMLKEYFGLDN